MLAAPQCVEMEEIGLWWQRIAVLEYAVMTATNAARQQRALTGEMALRALRQAMLDAVRGHARAGRVLHVPLRS